MEEKGLYLRVSNGSENTFCPLLILCTVLFFVCLKYPPFFFCMLFFLSLWARCLWLGDLVVLFAKDCCL